MILESLKTKKKKYIKLLKMSKDFALKEDQKTQKILPLKKSKS